MLAWTRSDQTKKVPAVGPGQVRFEHIRMFLAPYNATTFEYVPNDVPKRNPRPPHEIIHRAFSFYQRGFGEYNCAINNCEDFVFQCVFASPPLLSDQSKVTTPLLFCVTTPILALMLFCVLSDGLVEQGYAAAAAAGALGGIIMASTVLQQEEAARQRKTKRALMPACLAPRVD